MKTISSAVLLATTALMLAPSVSFGQQGGFAAYVMDRFGNPIKQARTGDCVRTRFWTPSALHPQCKPAATSSSGRK